MEIVNTIDAKGLQNFESQANTFLNHVDIDIGNDNFFAFAAQYKNRGYFYRIVIETPLQYSLVRALIYEYKRLHT